MIKTIDELKIELQKENFLVESQEQIDSIYIEIDNARDYWANQGNEEEAKKIWIIERIFLIKIRMINSWNLLVKRQYDKAWEEIVFCEKNLEYLGEHYNFVNDENDTFFLKKVVSYIKKIQSIFPIKLFLSPAFTIKDVYCNVCDKKITPFFKCIHKLREIYGGKMCLYYYDLSTIKIKHIAIVEDPVWKLRYIKPSKIDLDYSLVSMVIDWMKNPFDEIEVFYSNIQISHEEFNHFCLDDYCPCGSNCSYGACCLKNSYVQISAFKLQTSERKNSSHVLRLRINPEKYDNKRERETFSEIIRVYG